MPFALSLHAEKRYISLALDEKKRKLMLHFIKSTAAGLFKCSKYSSAYRFGYFSKKKKKWGHYAQVHRIRIQNEILSVIIGE